MRRVLIAAAAALMFVSTNVLADFSAGVIAHAMGQYDKAFQNFMPLAQGANHPYAEYYLGMMYERGQGVQVDMKKAAKWFLKSAKQGVQQSQYHLAELYAEGKGVPQDYERAYAWYAVAAKLGQQAAAAGQDDAKKHMSSNELAQAQLLASEYMKKYGKKPKKLNGQP